MPLLSDKPCFAYSFSFQDPVYGFGNFLESILIQIRPPSLNSILPKAKEAP